MSLDRWASSKIGKPPARVPRVRQQKDYSCGVAAALSVLRYFGVDEGDRERDLYEPLDLETPDKKATGTEVEDIVALLRRRGLRARDATGSTLDDLIEAHDKGEVTIVALQAWPDDERADWSRKWRDGHYVVVVDASARGVTIMDPVSEDAYSKMTAADLRARWHDLDSDDEKTRGIAIFVSGGRGEHGRLDHVREIADTE